MKYASMNEWFRESVKEKLKSIERRRKKGEKRKQNK